MEIVLTDNEVMKFSDSSNGARHISIIKVPEKINAMIDSSLRNEVSG
jgi:hypothetical protein